MSPAQIQKPRSLRKQASWSKQLVWDLPTRIFHWALAVCIVGAYLLARAPAPWFYWHAVLGVGAGLLVLWRIAWGFIGSRHARFRDLIFGPGSVMAYLRAVYSGEGQYYPAHNPGGAVAIWAILILAVVTVLTGFATASETLEHVHKLASNLLILVIVLHVAGVLIASAIHQENYARSMITGKKTAPASAAIANPRPVAAAVLVCLFAGAMAYFVAGVDFQSGVFRAPGTHFSLSLGEAEEANEESE